MKTIKFKNDWRYSRQGDVIEEGDGVAELLIARGIAEEVTKEAVEAAETPLVENGARTGVVTRRIPGPGEPEKPHGYGARQYPGQRGGRG